MWYHLLWQTSMSYKDGRKCNYEGFTCLYYIQAVGMTSVVTDSCKDHLDQHQARGLEIKVSNIRLRMMPTKHLLQQHHQQLNVTVRQSYSH
jgi:hypothetical protein